MPEEDCFCLMVKLLQDYGLRDYFAPDMTQLRLRLYQLECLIQDDMSEIWSHLEQSGINPSMFAAEWFLTLFSYRAPLTLVFRVVDAVLVDGPDFLLKLGMALLQRNKSLLLGVSDFAELLDTLKQRLWLSYESRWDLLLTDADCIALPASKMKRWEKQFRKDLAQEVSDMHARDAAADFEEANGRGTTHAISSTGEVDVTRLVEDNQSLVEEVNRLNCLLKQMRSDLLVAEGVRQDRDNARDDAEHWKLLYENLFTETRRSRSRVRESITRDQSPADPHLQEALAGTGHAKR